MLAQTIAAITTVGSQVLWVTRDGSPDDGPAWPADGFYSRVRDAGFEVQDIAKTDELAGIMRLVKKRYTAEQKGRGQLCVVRMTRVREEEEEGRPQRQRHRAAL